MHRFHLFEWEDQPWLPVVFRDFITDHLRYFLARTIREPVNRAIAQLLEPLLTRTGSRQIIDLCAGAGGPLLQVQRIIRDEMGEPVEVLLTDLYPNVAAFKRHELEGGGAVRAIYEPTSAFDVPPGLRGVRTLFTALHHFKPEGVLRLLADAAGKRQPIAVFELLERTPRMLILTGLFALLQAFVRTPIVGRLTPWRFLLTYVIPLAPAMLMWDGVVSVLRTYTPQELRDLTDSIGAADYDWEVGRFEIPGPLGVMLPTIYLLGCPVTSRDSGRVSSDTGESGAASNRA